MIYFQSTVPSFRKACLTSLSYLEKASGLHCSKHFWARSIIVNMLYMTLVETDPFLLNELGIFSSSLHFHRTLNHQTPILSHVHACSLWLAQCSVEVVDLSSYTLTFKNTWLISSRKLAQHEMLKEKSSSGETKMLPRISHYIAARSNYSVCFSSDTAEIKESDDLHSAVCCPVCCSVKFRKFIKNKVADADLPSDWTSEFGKDATC